MRTLLDLAKSLEAQAAKVSGVGNAKVKAVVAAIITDLANVSPVDTSLFVSNWRVTINNLPFGAVPLYVAGLAGSSREASGRAMIEAALQALSAKQPGQTVYISNMLPYARRLDTGYSGQFAGGFGLRASLIARNITEKKNG